MNQTSTQSDKTHILKKLAMWTIVPAGVVISALAFAGPGDERFPISIAEVESKTAERFARLDTDQSGGVDMAEFEQARPHGRQEGGKHRPGKDEGRRHGGPGRGMEGPDREQRMAMRSAVSEEMFTLLDSNGDGAISKAEYQGANMHKTRALAQSRALFKQFDKDQDQQLTLSEMPSPADRLRRADADNDGMVTRAEMRAVHALRHSNSQKGAKVEAD